MIINTVMNKQEVVSGPIAGIWSWGLNANNQLGDGTITNRSSPVFIKSVSTGDIQGIDCGKDFTLYVDYFKLWGWGYNFYGQLGDGTTTQRSSPVAIQTDQEYIRISCGDTHVACISGLDDALYSWGQNNFGQLGDGTTTNRSSPVIYTSVIFSEIACGASATAAIGPGGSYSNELYLWGQNADNRIPAYANFSAPYYYDIQIPVYNLELGGLNGFVMDDSITQLYGWGKNTYGSVGDGTTTDTGGTYLSSFGTIWVIKSSLSTTGPFTIGLKDDNTLWAWGRNNVGQLGLGDTTDRSSPVQIGTSAWSYIAVGYDHVIATKADGTLWAWGDNRNGQIGDGTTTNRSSPVQIGSGTYSLVGAGNRFSVALRLT